MLRLDRNINILLSRLLLIFLFTALGCRTEDSNNPKETKTSLPLHNSATALDQFPPDDIGAQMERLVLQEWKGDLDGMVTRGLVRILVPFGKSYYFHDGATERGPVAEAGRRFEKLLNRKYKRKTRRIVVAFIPVARDEMINGLVQGRGDIAAGGITITPLRKEQIDFTEPTLRNVSEVVVTGPDTAKLSGLVDLSGQEVHVRKASSYYESLELLNIDLKDSDKTPITVRLVDEALELDEVLEMVNAGLIPITVADSYLAELWSQVFEKITVHSELRVNSGQNIAWAFRKGSPKLKKELDGFIKKHRPGTEFGNIMVKRYFKKHRWLLNPTVTVARKRFEKTSKFFRKYGKQYNFDYLLLTAQGYQESELDQTKQSRSGAIGVMQLLPRTAREMNVGDIHDVESNIHAGTKYLRLVVDKYFNEETISPLNRMLFAFASYNAGPTRISKLRKQASREGLDSNKWFNNVELVVAKRVSSEPVHYVANIYKYYLAYRMARANDQRKSIAKEMG